MRLRQFGPFFLTVWTFPSQGLWIGSWSMSFEGLPVIGMPAAFQTGLTAPQVLQDSADLIGFVTALSQIDRIMSHRVPRLSR